MRCPYYFGEETHGPKVVIGSKSVAMMQRQNYFTARLRDPTLFSLEQAFNRKQAILATDKHKTHMEIFSEIHSAFKKTQSSQVLHVTSYKLFNKIANPYATTLNDLVHQADLKRSKQQ